MVTKRSGLAFAGLLILALVLVAPAGATTPPSLPPGIPVPVAADDPGIGTLYPSGPVADPAVPADGTAAFSAAAEPLVLASIGPSDSLQAAIDAAADGDTIVLDPGIYYEHGITISKNIRIQANASAGGSRYNTIIDADNASRIFNLTGTWSLALDSLTLRNATITGNGSIVNAPYGGTVAVTSSTIANCSVTGNGGAIYAKGVAVAVTASTFSNCSATRSGGAIYAVGGSTVSITASTFENCSAFAGRSGGAIYSEYSTLTITTSAFYRCSGGSGYTGQGGAIECAFGNAIITTSTFENCTAGTAGGTIDCSSGCNAVFDNSTITGNSAHWGGAILVFGNLTLRGNTTISGCSADYGGAITMWPDFGTDTALHLTSATISGCSATTKGGAIHVVVIGTHTTITSSTITGCSAPLGGAIASDDPSHNPGVPSTIDITSSTITGCSATTDGGAISSDGATTTIHFCRLYHNTASGSGPAINSTSTADATNNWWGSNSDPAAQAGGPVTTNPWLVLGITATPSSITAGQLSAIRANLTFDSAHGFHPPAAGHIPEGIPAAFAIESGPGGISPGDGTVTSGANATLFTPAGPGTTTISATVDDQPVSVEIPVSDAPAPAITGITPNQGVNTTSTNITSLAGTGFWLHGTTTVLLMRTGHANITATSVVVVGENRITCMLPVTGAETGAWDVVVVSPDGKEGIRPRGFTVILPEPRPFPTLDTSNNDDGFPSTAGGLPLMTVTVNIGGDSKAWQAVVTGTKLSDLIVTGTVQPGSGSNMTPPPGIVFQYISLVPARYDSITKAVIHFSVPQSWLDENHIDPKSIVLYHQTANGWEALPTTMLSAKDGTVYFSAESTGFSFFAIAGTPGVTVPEVTAMTTQGIMIQVVQNPASAPVVNVPVTTPTTAPPASPEAPTGSSPVPLIPVLIVIGCVGLAGSGWYVRRWWIRRQNPALFREYD
jgi:hypothetical protein